MRQLVVFRSDLCVVLDLRGQVIVGQLLDGERERKTVVDVCNLQVSHKQTHMHMQMYI